MQGLLKNYDIKGIIEVIVQEVLLIWYYSARSTRELLFKC